MTTPNPTTVLAEMQARCDAATEGPWESYGDLDHEVFANWPGVDEAPYIAHSIARGNDSVFIAHARTYLPLTIAALQAVLGVHRKTTATYDGGRIVQEVCAACNHASQFGVPGLWPCPTVRTITEALKGEL